MLTVQYSHQAQLLGFAVSRATILCVFCMEMWMGAENGGTKENRVKLRKISKITKENTRKGLASMLSEWVKINVWCQSYKLVKANIVRWVTVHSLEKEQLHELQVSVPSIFSFAAFCFLKFCRIVLGLIRFWCSNEKIPTILSVPYIVQRYV